MARYRKVRFVASALGIIHLLCAGAFAGRYSALYIFGDSLSAIVKDGMTYVDVLAKNLALGAVTASETGGNNYASWGARSGDGYTNPPSIRSQVEEYLTGLNEDSADPNALYIVEGGANDAILATGQGSLDNPPSVIMETAAGHIVASVRALVDKGAKTILVFDIPDIGLSPAYRSRANTSGDMTEIFNSKLAFGLNQITGATILVYKLSRFVSSNVPTLGESFFKADGIHPSTAVHGLLGEEITKVVFFNRPPAISTAIQEKSFIVGGDPQVIHLNSGEPLFDDPDGDVLSFSAHSSDTSVVKAIIEADSLILTPGSNGTAVITIGANDRNSGQASFAFDVFVRYGSYSVSLDLNMSEGDQGVSSFAGVSSGFAISIQIFGKDMSASSGLESTFELGNDLVYEGFDLGDLFADVTVQVTLDSATLSLTNPLGMSDGLIGTIRLRTSSQFEGATISISDLSLNRKDQSERLEKNPSVRLSVRSPDFNGDGQVGFSDFVHFAGTYGSKLGDTRYDSRTDLDGNGAIEFSDFVLFVQDYGSAVAI
ncbi:MAG: SGNH/GDSL hydrolase family protein [Bacteroidetes bacterium]|nr:SGNH/GDSL hydrolase family protein [Bacteroidota bacterium]